MTSATRARLARWLALPVGAALPFAFAPFDAWWLAILCPAFLFLSWRDAAPRAAAQLGFLFTAGLYLSGTYWLYYSIHGIGKAPLPLTLFVMLGMVAILSSYTAALGYVLARWFNPSHLATDPATTPDAQRIAQARVIVQHLMVFPAAWVLLEWFRGWFLSGFPWLALGYSQIDTYLAGLAPLGGVYTISFAVAICAGALALLARGPGGAPALIAIALMWLLGFAFDGREWTQSTGAPVRAAIVQGAVPQDLKWSAQQRDATVALYSELTTPHLGVDIVLWPEAALPILAHNALQTIAPLIESAQSRGTTLVTGLVRYDPQSEAYYNGLIALNGEPQWYYKRRLVPFGEFFPVPQFVREWLRLMNLPYSDLTPGPAEQPALRAGKHYIGVTICYEDAYGAEQLDVLRTATLLVNVTNDAWFGDSTAAHQHLQISRMRALEAGRPLLRAANDGVSAIIGANGEVASTFPRFEPGVLTGVVQPRTGLTPYARVGNAPLIIVCALLLLLCFRPHTTVAQRRAKVRR